MALVDVDALTGPDPGSGETLARRLEEGSILLFRRPPFAIPDADREFLLSRRQGGGRLHKNIAYRPARDRVTGATGDRAERERLGSILRAYSRAAVEHLSRMFPAYARSWHVDYASFRPIEEEGRSLSQTSRNDLLHVDAFPSRPTHGARILRVFVNINPAASRVWNVGQPFHALLPEIMHTQKLAAPHRNATTRALLRLAAKLGLRVPDRSPYDEFMLYFHDWLKENADFQKNSPKRKVTFPPGACWMVYTDGVPHAVLSGQFALEQTFLIPPTALVSPEAAPIHVLEAVTGAAMAT